VFTRCPGCHTVHPVSAALLAGGKGRYRCGKCNKINNALEALFDQWPKAGARPAAAGEMPVLGLSLDLEAAAKLREPSATPAEDADETGAAKARGKAARLLLRTAWVAGGIVVAAVVAYQWAEFRGRPLLPGASADAALERLGLKEPPPAAVFRDLESIHLVNRELRSHPFIPGRLRLNATIVNRAGRSQPYPGIEVTLLDAAGQVLSQERFVPADYLAAGSVPANGMTPQAYLPLTLELADPGVRAVGFELQFH
jgi:predicted Zn finger-like uncharacterized protein